MKFRKKKIKSLSYRKIAIYLNTHMVCILTTLATYKFFWSKITASCGVMYVTLIRLPSKHETCDQYHLLFSCYVHFLKCFDYFVLTNSFWLETIQSLLLDFKYSVLYVQLNNPKAIPNFKEQNSVGII